MSIARAEQLKRDLTDKFVLVAKSIPELRRFEGLTGKVKTVNMNCRALVEFNGPVDIGWYDIDPSFLQIVDAPVKTAVAGAHAPAAPAKAAAPAAPAKAAGKSPLDQIRAGGAPKSAAAPASAGEKKASPLDQIRAGGAAKSAAAPAAPGEKKVSPLDQIRAKAAEKAAAATPEATAPASVPDAPAPAPSSPAMEPPVKPAGAKPTSTADILASIRKKK